MDTPNLTSYSDSDALEISDDVENIGDNNNLENIIETNTDVKHCCTNDVKQSVMITVIVFGIIGAVCVVYAVAYVIGTANCKDNNESSGCDSLLAKYIIFPMIVMFYGLLIAMAVIFIVYCILKIKKKYCENGYEIISDDHVIVHNNKDLECHYGEL